jgi:hypothetical protein
MVMIVEFKRRRMRRETERALLTMMEQSFDNIEFLRGGGT